MCFESAMREESLLKMFLAQSNFSSIIQLHQWLTVVTDIAAVGLLEVKPSGLIFRASNFVMTSFIELTVNCEVYFSYVRPFYVNIQLPELLQLINGWIQDGLIGGQLIFTTDDIILQLDDNRRSIPITLSQTPFQLDAKSCLSLDQLVVEFPLTEFQNIIRELSIVGQFAKIEADNERNVKFSSRGSLAYQSFETKNGKCKVVKDDLIPGQPLNLEISLCNLKTITLLNTSNVGYLRFIPNRLFIFEAAGMSDINMLICISTR